MNNKIAIIGDKDSILAFKAIGVDVFPIKDGAHADDTLKRLAREYSVIFVTEDIFASVSETAERYKTKPFPAVIPIPSAAGSMGYGMNNISKNVEKALGVDIFNK